MGMTIPASYGGQRRVPTQDVVLVIEEMAKVCGVTGRISSRRNMGAIGAIMKYGSEAQKRVAANLVLARRQAGDLHHRARSRQRRHRDDDARRPDAAAATSSTAASTGSPAAACRACI